MLLRSRFSNPNGEYGYSVSVYLVDRTTGKSDGSVTDEEEYLQGIWTANVPTTANPGPFALNHTHEADIYIFRRQSAVSICHLVAYRADIEDIGYFN
jgi:hypothetical protein